MTTYDQLLVKRGDVNQDGVTNGGDAAALYANFGQSSWLMDLNVDGAVDIVDVETLVTELVRTSFADFNLDRQVDGSDFLTWQRGLGDGLFPAGDATRDGVVDGDDLAIWRADLGQIAPTVSAGAAGAEVPEPSAGALVWMAATGGAAPFAGSRRGGRPSNITKQT
jgi:hypothetical protein